MANVWTDDYTLLNSRNVRNVAQRRLTVDLQLPINGKQLASAAGRCA